MLGQSVRESVMQCKMPCAIRPNKCGKKISIIAISATHRNRWDYFIDLPRIQDLTPYLQREMFSNIAWEDTSVNIQADWLLSWKVETPFRKSFKNVRLYSS